MINSLFHITHIDNLPGIISNGLICRKTMLAYGLSYQDLSDPSCQSKRTRKRLATEIIDLHGYVPLFINPHNPMLYRLQRTQQEQGSHGALVILELTSEPFRLPASLVSDGIASSSATRLFHADDPAVSDALDWNAIRSRSWNDGPEGTGRRLMAEVLVAGTVGQLHIRKIWVQNPFVLLTVTKGLPQSRLPVFQVDLQRRLFFR